MLCFCVVLYNHYNTTTNIIFIKKICLQYTKCTRNVLFMNLIIFCVVLSVYIHIILCFYHLKKFFSFDLKNVLNCLLLTCDFNNYSTLACVIYNYRFNDIIFLDDLFNTIRTLNDLS